MNTFELRKVIQVGYGFSMPEKPPILDARGQNVEPVKTPYTATIAFWIPAPHPYARCPGLTRVVDASVLERQALKDGAIFEHIQSFTFEREPTAAEMKKRLMAVWDGLTAQSLGVAFQGVPEDSTTKPVLEFLNITKSAAPMARCDEERA